MKTCSSKACQEINPQPEENFHVHRRSKSGRQSLCKRCRALKYEDKKDIILQKAKMRYRANPTPIKEKAALWQKTHKKAVKAKNSRWKRNNLDKVAAQASKRRSSRINAQPPWLNRQQIKEIQWFYATAKELSWLSEEPLQVDHIVPLLGKAVCGLHVPWNLQILPKSANLKKGNRLL